LGERGKPGAQKLVQNSVPPVRKSAHGVGVERRQQMSRRFKEKIDL